MKILVLYHNAWIEAMYKSWQRSGQVEVASLPLPVVDWDGNPALKDKIARLIVDYAMVWKPDAIVDVNGAGVMPVSGQELWTPELAMIPWMEWWWDDPFLYAGERRAAGVLEPWLRAIGCPLVKNFIWDAALAKEYSEWTGKPWRHLPLATDPSLYSPESAERSHLPFAPVDVCFLGRFFEKPNPDNSSFSREINLAVSRRIMRPSLDYFETIAAEPSLFVEIGALFSAAKRKRWGAFGEGISAFKADMDGRCGYFLRCEPLNRVAELFPSRFFAGDGMPARFSPYPEKIFAPAALSARYGSAKLSLDFPGGRNFSGTNMRVYEIMASGGAMACSRRPDFDVEGEFDGKAYFSFEKPEELKALVERLEKDKGLRASVSSEARSLIRRGHSWLNRLPALMEAASQA